MDGLNETFSLVEEAPVVEDFKVDDLLDLRGLPEPEKDEEEDDDAAEGVVFVSVEKKESLYLSGISLPEETDAADLEWLSCFVHDCHSEYQPAFVGLTEHHTPCFPTKQPSPAAGRLKNETFIPVKAKRSKRHRRAGAFWFISCTSRVSFITSTPSSSSSFSSSSYLSEESYQKKRGRKPKSSIAGGVSSERRCTHCGVQKTPQWRTGPHGPKTLCNACGVRFKAGRLLPEYRPACSPTFVSNIHSNKHRKVLEMRRKKEGQLFSAAAPPVQSC